MTKFSGKELVRAAVQKGKEKGTINEGLLLFWFDLSPSSAALLYRQLKQLCMEGILDTDNEQCVVGQGHIYFRPVKSDGQ